MSASPPTAWTRLEHHDLPIVDRLAENTGGMVLTARHDAELRDAVVAAGIPFIVDLETWRLAFVDPDNDPHGDLRSPLARAVPLPLTPSALADDAVLERLVRAAIRLQAGAARIIAPSFAFSSLDDPWCEINRRAIAMTRKLAGRQPVAAWIVVPQATVTDGTLHHAVAFYAQALARGASVMLTTGEMRDDIGADALAPWLRAIGLFRAAGLAIEVDRAGYHALAAVADPRHGALGAALGAALGTRALRCAQDPVGLDRPRRGGIPVAYFDGDRGRRVPRRKARERHRKGRLRCPNRACRALQSRDNRELRLHNAHELRRQLERVREMGLAQIMRIWAHGLKHQRMWAQALEEASADRAEA